MDCPYPPNPFQAQKAMPIYAYKCESCGHSKDVLQKISDAPLTECPACHASTFRKQITAAGFQLKGSGWYVTDFRGGNGGANGATTGATAPATTASSGSEAAASSPSTESSSASTAKSDAAPTAAGGCGGGCACHG